MKKIIVVLGCLALIFAFSGNGIAAPKEKCITIQSGDLYASDSSVIETGYDVYGYNYQAHMFNGSYCDSDRVVGGVYCDVNLIMKWNDAWLSNKSCDTDDLLDRHFDFDSYIGSGAWVTNHQSGVYDGGGGVLCTWVYFVKIVAAPADAYQNWDLLGDWILTFDFESDLYIHDIKIDDNKFTGTGGYPSPGLYTLPWTVAGTIDEDAIIEMRIDYDNSSYYVDAVGTIAGGTMSGTWVSSLGQTGVWESTAGNATNIWYAADGTEIGPEIWGDFAIIQEVSNDACAGEHGVQYLSPVGPGFGKFKP